MRISLARVVVGISILTCGFGSGMETTASQLDPRGTMHLPIGIPNTLDTLKTFVEAEGNFSPGYGSYGIYFWIYDQETGTLAAPTMEEVRCERGLNGRGHLIPWSSWKSGDLMVKTEVCEVEQDSPEGRVFVVGARAQAANTSEKRQRVSFFVAVRPVGPAGWAIADLAVSESGDTLLVDGHTALVSNETPSGAGVVGSDTIGEFAQAGKLPAMTEATSERGDCSGALRFDFELEGGETRTLGFVCPVLAGRRAVGHKWDGKSVWAQLDEAQPNPAEGGVLQPDPGLAYYRGLKADGLFEEAEEYWREMVGRAIVRVPDRRWGECFAATIGHVGVSMNEGAPDVAVVNYNVFNRDGVYVANILQKSGHFELAEEAIDYFLSHPFNGRVYPEADNPGQVLWIIGEQWLFTRDERWLKRVYGSVKKLAEMVRYYRTTEGTHWVSSTSLDFGKALPEEKRQELKPGKCDGYHPEYTEAFDIAGLRGACLLAKGMANKEDEAGWRKLADSLLKGYDERFGPRLPKDYGSYSVLWPCRLYPLGSGKAHQQFKDIGVQKPSGWRYFPLATAHQGFLAGNREAGHGTVELHLNHEQMAGWYLFDEGGKSGPGGWRHVRTTWNADVAMPHGWAIAELWLLLRDCLLYEDGSRLVLLRGVPEEWFTHPEGMEVKQLPTHFGRCSFRYTTSRDKAGLELLGSAAPPGGFVLSIPRSLRAKVIVEGMSLPRSEEGDFVLPRGTNRAEIAFAAEN